MMVTFTKLLEIRIVAKSRSESSKRANILRSLSLLLWLISLKSLGEREKNAISEADTKPEQKSNTIASTMAMIAPTVGVFNVMLLKRSASWHKYESGSKE